MLCLLENKSKNKQIICTYLKIADCGFMVLEGSITMASAQTTEAQTKTQNISKLELKRTMFSELVFSCLQKLLLVNQSVWPFYFASFAERKKSANNSSRKSQSLIVLEIKERLQHFLISSCSELSVFFIAQFLVSRMNMVLTQLVMPI